MQWRYEFDWINSFRVKWLINFNTISSSMFDRNQNTFSLSHKSNIRYYSIVCFVIIWKWVRSTLHVRCNHIKSVSVVNVIIVLTPLRKIFTWHMCHETCVVYNCNNGNIEWHFCNFNFRSKMKQTSCLRLSKRFITESVSFYRISSDLKIRYW